MGLGFRVEDLWLVEDTAARREPIRLEQHAKPRGIGAGHNLPPKECFQNHSPAK